MSSALVAIPSVEEILMLHSMQLARFGGMDGTRDRTMIESALGRAQSLVDYADADAIGVAAGLCHSIVKNHAFLDGNKRTAFAALNITLALNGCRLTAEPIEAANMVIDLASSRINAEECEAWVRIHAEVDQTHALLAQSDTQVSLDEPTT